MPKRRKANAGASYERFMGVYDLNFPMLFLERWVGLDVALQDLDPLSFL